MIINRCVCLFLHKTEVVDAHLKCLGEVLLMSTYNFKILWGIVKKIANYHKIPTLIELLSDGHIFTLR